MDLNTGIALIDEQHATVFEAIKGLEAAIQDGMGMGLLEATLTTIYDYASYHFKTEEDSFGLVEYPEASKHHHQHRLLLDQLSIWLVVIKRQRPPEPQEVLEYLKIWHENHITRYDLPWARLLLDKQITLAGHS